MVFWISVFARFHPLETSHPYRRKTVRASGEAKIKNQMTKYYSPMFVFLLHRLREQLARRGVGRRLWRARRPYGGLIGSSAAVTRARCVRLHGQLRHVLGVIGERGRFVIQGLIVVVGPGPPLGPKVGLVRGLTRYLSTAHVTCPPLATLATSTNPLALPRLLPTPRRSIKSITPGPGTHPPTHPPNQPTNHLPHRA